MARGDKSRRRVDLSSPPRWIFRIVPRHLREFVAQRQAQLDFRRAARHVHQLDAAMVIVCMKKKFSEVSWLAREKFDLSTPAGLCGAFSDFARICQEDAMRLEDCSQGYTSPGAYILIAHALELSLKAFLAKHQLSEKELRSRHGHDLDCLYNKAIEVGLHLSVPNPKKTIARVNKYHNENALRCRLCCLGSH
jgi:hypothetical protein